MWQPRQKARGKKKDDNVREQPDDHDESADQGAYHKAIHIAWFLFEYTRNCFSSNGIYADGTMGKQLDNARTAQEFANAMAEPKIKRIPKAHEGAFLVSKIVVSFAYVFELIMFLTCYTATL